MKYQCSNCGKFHDDLPALTFQAPHHYDTLSEIEKKKIGEISSDFCVIRYEEQTDRFIRVVLNQKIVDYCEMLQYGVWVSVSEKSFNEYKNNFMPSIHEAGFFGYLMNQIPGYKDTLLTKTDVCVSIGNKRPEIFPHKSEIDTNEFTYDYYNGISIEEANRRIQLAMGV